MRKALLSTLVAAGVAAGGLVPAATASAAAPPPPLVVIRMNGHHMHVVNGDGLKAGRIDFEGVSVDGKTHVLQLAYLHKGYSAQEAFSDLNKGFGGDAKAIRRFDRHVSLHGGARATATKPGWFEVSLAPHPYLVLDQRTNAVTQLTVHRPLVKRSHTRPDANIAAFTYGFGNISKNLPAVGYIRLWNHADQPHFFSFQRVKPDTRPRDVRRVQNGQQRPTFLLKGGTESGVVSPNTGEVMHFDMRPGKYLLACFWPDDRDGMPHFNMGMWKLVTFH